MNPQLQRLHPYPFEKLRELLAGIPPCTAYSPIRLSIGEPQHPTPELIRNALVEALDGLATYPTTQGSETLRNAIAAWLQRRYGLPSIDPATQVLPVNGSREALFAFGQCVLDASQPGGAKVLFPNPFYQIYEGTALLAGATPVYLDQCPQDGFASNFERIDAATWRQVQLVFVCSPGNPTGRVMPLEEWRTLFELADQHDFVIAADECYSEIYFDEAAPPLGALQAAIQLGRADFRRLVVFSSLSKRSNVPGLRSGFVAGDAALLQQFLRYRTYHGCAMSPVVQAASIAAWNDEAHVLENRRLYREKFDAVTPLLSTVLRVEKPQAGFYLWAGTPIADTDFARGLQAEYNVSVLPGRFLGRSVSNNSASNSVSNNLGCNSGQPDPGSNPGEGFVRIALVAEPSACLEAAHRIVSYTRALR